MLKILLGIVYLHITLPHGSHIVANVTKNDYVPLCTPFIIMMCLWIHFWD